MSKNAVLKAVPFIIVFIGTFSKLQANSLDLLALNADLEVLRTATSDRVVPSIEKRIEEKRQKQAAVSDLLLAALSADLDVLSKLAAVAPSVPVVPQVPTVPEEEVAPEIASTATDDFVVEETPVVIAEPEPLPVATTATEMDMSIELPIFGTLPLKFFTEPAHGNTPAQSGFKARVPARNEQVSWGPLILNSGEFRYVGDQLSYTAHAQFFGKDACITLKNVTEAPESKSQEAESPGSQPGVKKSKYKKHIKKIYTKLGLKVSFTQESSTCAAPAGQEKIDFSPPQLELIPGQPAKLESAEIIFQKNEPVEVKVAAQLFGQPVQISMKQADVRLALTANGNPVPLKNLIPQVDGTPLADAQIADLSITIKNLFTKAMSRKARAALGAKAQLPKIIEFNGEIAKAPAGAKTPTGVKAAAAVEKSQAIMHGTIIAGKGLKFEASMHEISLPGIGAVKDCVLSIDTMDGKRSIVLKGMSDITIPGAGTFAAKISAEFKKVQQKTAQAASAQAASEIEISGTIEQTISYAGIDIKNATVAYSTKNKQLSIAGDGEIQGHAAHIVLSRSANEPIKAEASLHEKSIKPFSSIGAAFVSDITLTDPVFKFIESRNAKTGRNEFEFVMQGAVTILGLQVDGSVYLKRTASGTIYLLETQAASPTKSWKLSDGISSLRNTIFDNIALQQLQFIVSSGSYKDPEKGVTYEEGINFVANTTFSGPLVPVAALTGQSQSSKLEISGYLAPDPLESIFRAELPPPGINIKSDSVQMRNAMIQIKGNPLPTLALALQIDVEPNSSNRDEKLTFTASIAVSPTDALLAGTMEGKWDNALGIHNFAIENVALQLGLTYALLPIPTELGLAGTFDIGKRTVSLAANVSQTRMDHLVLAGSLNELTLADLVDLASKITTVPIPTFGIPVDEMSLHDIKMYIAPQKTFIGTLAFEKGFEVSGKLFLPGFTAVGKTLLSSDGFKFLAFCTPITYGPLKITRAKAEATKKMLNASGDIVESADRPREQADAAAATKALAKAVKDEADATAQLQKATSLLKQVPSVGNKQLVQQATDVLKEAHAVTNKASFDQREAYAAANGPIMKLALTLDEQEILVSGRFELGDIFQEEAFFKMSRDGIAFNFETTLGDAMYYSPQEHKRVPLLQTKIFGRSSGKLSEPSKLQFEIALDFQQHFQDFVKEQVKSGIDSAKEKVEHDINKAISDVEKIKAVIQDTQEKIDGANRDVQRAKDALRAINDAIAISDREIQRQQDKVNSLENQIRDMQKRIDDAQDEFNHMAWYEKIYGWAKVGGEIIGFGTALAGLEVSKNVANAVLEAAKYTAKGALIGAKTTAEQVLVGAQGFLNQVGSNVSRGVLEAARQTGEGILVGAREGTLGVMEGGKFVATQLLSAFNLQSLHYDGNLQDMAHGQLGNVEAKMELLGNDVSLHFSLNLKGGFDVVKDSVMNLVHKVVDQISSIPLVQESRSFVKQEPEVMAAAAKIKALQYPKMPVGLTILDMTAWMEQTNKDMNARRDELMKQAQEAAQKRLKAEQDKVNDAIKKTVDEQNIEVAKTAFKDAKNETARLKAVRLLAHSGIVLTKDAQGKWQLVESSPVAVNTIAQLAQTPQVASVQVPQSDIKANIKAAQVVIGNHDSSHG